MLCEKHRLEMEFTTRKVCPICELIKREERDDEPEYCTCLNYYGVVDGECIHCGLPVKGE